MKTEMKHEAPTETAQEIHEALYDGADIPVSFRPGSAGVPPAEVIKIRKIPREQFTEYSLVIGDDSATGELREAALYTARDETWAATLDDESLTRVLEEGHRLNFFTFARWFRRRGRTLQLMNGNEAWLRQAVELIQDNPRLSHLLGSTNGSSVRATGTPTSGAAARTN